MELVRFADPSPRGAELLVRITCCTLCRSDLHTHAGRRTEPTPTVLGHEIVGRIEAFGPEASHVDARGLPVSVGGRVSWAVAVGCGAVLLLPKTCRKSASVHSKYGHMRVTPERPWGGGLADMVVLTPGTALFTSPGCGRRSCGRPRELRHGDRRRHAAARAARSPGAMSWSWAPACWEQPRAPWPASAGARTVLAGDPEPACLERAAAFGATHTFPAEPDELAARVAEATHGRGADVVLELAGVPASVAAGLSLVRTGGVLILAGTVAPVGNVGFDPESVVRRMLTIRGVHNYHPRDLESALTFLAGPGRSFPFASLVAAEYPLAQAEQALAYAHAHPRRPRRRHTLSIHPESR